MSAALHAWPTLDEECAVRLDLIAQRLSRGNFALGGGVWTFRLTPVASGLQWPDPAFVLHAQWGGCSLRLISTPALPALLYAHQFPDAALEAVPQDLALAGMALAWGELTQRLEALGGRKVVLLDAGLAIPGPIGPDQFHYALSLDSETAADGLQAILALDADGIALLAMLARRLPEAPVRRDPATALRLRLDIGSLRLTLGLLRTLAPNDILIPDNPIEPLAPQLWLRLDRRHVLRGRLADEALIIETTMERTTMPAFDDLPDDLAGDASFDELEITVGFDLGSKTITLGELAAVKAGQVFALDAPLARVVTLRANGRRIGHGELVRVDDRVGVRVLALLEQDVAAQAQGDGS